MYDIFKRKFKIIYDLDLFGKEPELYFKGKKKKVTLIGTFLTLLYFALYVVIFVYKFIKMIKKEEVNFYETYAYSEVPSIDITNKIFYGGFALGDIPFINETIYYPKVEYYKGVRLGGIMNYTIEEIEIERCQLEKFGSTFKEIFKDQPLSNLYCVKNMNFLFEGYMYREKHSFIKVTFYRCDNKTKDGIPCQNISTIDEYLYTNAVQFFFQDIDLTPENYSYPTKSVERVILSPIYKKLYQKIYAYLQIVIIDTDKDFIGLKNFWENNIEKYLKYEEAWIISAPNEGQTYEENKPLCEINIELSEKVLTQKRTVKLIDLFGEI